MPTVATYGSVLDGNKDGENLSSSVPFALASFLQPALSVICVSLKQSHDGVGSVQQRPDDVVAKHIEHVYSCRPAALVPTHLHGN